MTAEILLLVLLFSATALSAGLAALIVATLGAAGWLVVLALAVCAALALRLVADRLAAHAGLANKDLLDTWRAGPPPA